MPAIQPDRLKQQVAGVAAHFDQPAAFIRALQDLFEFYSDRTHRSGQAVPPPPLIPAYNIPAPVIRRVVRDLEPCLSQEPEAALRLADALWEEEYLELRLLGLLFLGRIPTSPPEPLLERVQAWARPKLEERLLGVLLTEGVTRLKIDAQEAYLELIRTWLGSSDTGTRKIGLLALTPLIANPDFLNLPQAFKLLSPLVHGAPSELRPYLLENVVSLAQRSPQETAYFLRQALTGAQDTTPAWLIRHSLDHYPPDTQANLKSALRNS